MSNGIQYLEHCLNNIHNFAIESCKILVSNDLDTKTRIYIAVFIKNYICDIWNDNKILQGQKKVNFINNYIIGNPRNPVKWNSNEHR